MLWVVLGQLKHAHMAEGAGRGSRTSLELWSNMLRVLDDHGVDRRNLARLARLSKRAANSRLSEVVRGGWAEELARDGAIARVRWTDQGSQAARRWPALHARAEKRWRGSVSEGLVDSLRTNLEALVGQFPLEHPHYPASYGAADASVTGGLGHDWSPVRRIGDGGVSGLPLAVLVSQAAVNFAMVYEERADVAFSLAATVLTNLPTEGRPLPELASRAWLSALERHGYLRAIAERRADGSNFVLTERGRRCAEGHGALVQQAEADWTARYGRGVVRSLREALEGVADR